jgi:hypothetical protein
MAFKVIGTQPHMQVERQQHMRVGFYERSTDRRGYANGCKPETVNTRITPITINIPY